jgi:hypothetical protein
MRRLALAVLAAASIGAQPVHAQDLSPVVGKSEQIGGRGVAAWAVAWNRWILAFKRDALETEGDCLPAPGGPVQFLSGRGPDDEHVVTVNCTVTSDRYLLLGTPLAICTDVVLPRKYRPTDAGLRRCAREFWSYVADPDPRLVLDGAPLPNGFVVHSPAFRFTLPSRDNLFGRPGVRSGRAAIAGRPVMLRPLPPGHHTLIQGVHYRITHNYVVVFQLTVV